MSTSNGNLLEVKDLRTYFQTEDGTVKAVDGITFSLKRGETLGIVGESGSGKSVTNLSVIRLIPSPPGEIVSGEVIFDGQDLLRLSEEAVRKIRGRRIAMIFQDPMTSLNPFMKISRQLMEMTQLHLGHSRAQAYDHAVKMLETVGIPDARARADSYPHEFSGGMRQRVMIAMALSCKPELLIADEPTTALDVTIQAQILELIKTLKGATGASVILITHDLGVIAGMTDDVIVMYAGKVFEQAPTKELFAQPANPYTKGLLRSVPDPTASQGSLYQIPGQPPDLAHLPPGCPFAPRCERAEEICISEYPPFVQLTTEHYSLCHFAEQVFGNTGKVNKPPEPKERTETVADLRKDLVQDLVESCKLEHSDAVSSFASLDLKAQNTITVAGIFLAGALVFFRTDSLQQFVTIGSKGILVLLGLAVIPLILSIGFCIRAMWIREISIGDTVLSVKEVQRIFKQPDELLPELFEVHMFDQAEEWNRLSNEIRDVNQRKADKVRWGQLFLAVAIGFAAALLFYTLYAIWILPPKAN